MSASLYALLGVEGYIALMGAFCWKLGAKNCTSTHKEEA